MNPTIRTIMEKLRPTLDAIEARYRFEPAAQVEITDLDPGHPDDLLRIDIATMWCEFVEHRGRYRRHVDAAGHRVTRMFEHELDAQDFRERFA